MKISDGKSNGGWWGVFFLSLFFPCHTSKRLIHVTFIVIESKKTLLILQESISRLQLLTAPSRQEEKN
jgi:hypothetical protein